MRRSGAFGVPSTSGLREPLPSCVTREKTNGLQRGAFRVVLRRFGPAQVVRDAGVEVRCNLQLELCRNRLERSTDTVGALHCLVQSS